MLILKIAGLVLLGLVVIVGLVALFIIYKIRKFARSIGEAVAGANNLPPIRITLTPESNPEWRSGEQIEKWTEEFKKLGFQDAGTFSIPEMNGLLLRGFCHTGENLIGVVYDHLKIAPTFDISCRYEDKSSLCGTSTTFGETVDSYPNADKIRLNTNSVAEVFDAVMKGLKNKPRVARSPEGFAPDFLRAYKEETNWRLKKGGTNREEIRRQAQKDGTEVTEEQLDEVYTNMRGQYVAQLQEACIAQYLDDSRLSVVEWQGLEHRAFAIAETFDWNEIVEILETQMDLDEEQVQQLKSMEFPFGTDALQMIDRVMEQRPAGLKLEKKGEVQEPVRAYILLKPA